ncbi:MAG: hypothetical protein EA398_16750, partial [Deltaproteobacteria bacterium]
MLPPVLNVVHRTLSRPLPPLLLCAVAWTLLFFPSPGALAGTPPIAVGVDGPAGALPTGTVGLAPMSDEAVPTAAERDALGAALAQLTDARALFLAGFLDEADEALARVVQGLDGLAAALAAEPTSARLAHALLEEWVELGETDGEVAERARTLAGLYGVAEREVAGGDRWVVRLLLPGADCAVLVNGVVREAAAGTLALSGAAERVVLQVRCDGADGALHAVDRAVASAGVLVLRHPRLGGVFSADGPGEPVLDGGVDEEAAAALAELFPGVRFLAVGEGEDCLLEPGEPVRCAAGLSRGEVLAALEAMSCGAAGCGPGAAESSSASGSSAAPAEAMEPLAGVDGGRGTGALPWGFAVATVGAVAVASGLTVAQVTRHDTFQVCRDDAACRADVAEVEEREAAWLRSRTRSRVAWGVAGGLGGARGVLVVASGAG